MPGSSTEAATLIHDVNQRAKELYLELGIKNIDEAEYREAITRLVAQQLVAFVEHALSVRSRSSTEDICQETMLRFLQHEPNISVIPILQWLFRVATNYTIDEWRRTRREEPTEPTVIANSAIGGRPVSKSRAMEEQQVLEIAVKDAFGTLEEDWRPSAYLCLALRFTQSATAEILNLPETTVNYYVRLSRERLRANPQLREFRLRARGRE